MEKAAGAYRYFRSQIIRELRTDGIHDLEHGSRPRVRRHERDLDVRGMFARVAAKEIAALCRGHAHIRNHRIQFRNILPDHALDRSDGLRRLLHTGSHWIFNRDGEHTLVLIREKFRTDKLKDKGRDEGQRKNTNDNDFPMSERPFEHLLVGLIDAFDRIVENHTEPVRKLARCAIHFFFRRQEFQAEQRRDRPRNEEGAEERNRDRDRQWREKKFGDAAQKHHRKKNDDGRKRGDENGRGHFARGGKRLLDFRFARFGIAVMPGDYFQLHDGIIHQSSHGERQSPKRHDVQRDTAESKHDEGNENRHRNRHEDNNRPTKIAQEDHDNRHSEDGADERLAGEAADRLADIERLIEGERDVDVRRNPREMRKSRDDIIDDIDRVRLRELLHSHHKAGLAIDTDGLGLLLVTIFNGPDIANANRDTGGILKHNIADGLNEIEQALGL